MQATGKICSRTEILLRVAEVVVVFYVLITAALIQFVAVLIRYTAGDVQVFLRWENVGMQIK